MNTAFIVTFKQPIPGREKIALDYAAEVNEFWGKLAADGKVTVPELFLFPNGIGMWMVKGDAIILRELVESEYSQKLLTKGLLLLEDFESAFAFTGAAVDAQLALYGQLIVELALV